MLRQYACCNVHQVNNINKQHYFSVFNLKINLCTLRLFSETLWVWLWKTWNLWRGKVTSDDESSWLLKKGLHHSSVCVLFFPSTVANEAGESSSRPLARFAREFVQSDTRLKAVDFTFTLELFPAQWDNRYECDTVKFTVFTIPRVCDHNSNERC